MNVIAIDPGTTQSGYIIAELDFVKRNIDFGKFGKEDNFEMMDILLNTTGIDCCIIEMPINYSGAKTVDLTNVWIGRMIAKIRDLQRQMDYYLIPRSSIISHMKPKKKDRERLGIIVKGNDSIIRGELIRYFGADKCKGIAKDAWQALALLKTFYDGILSNWDKLTPNELEVNNDF